MKIQIMSDLHLESCAKFYMNPDVDAHIVAGDVVNRLPENFRIFDLIESTDKPILYVPGNHEYYGTSFEKVEETLDKLCVDYPHFINLNVLDAYVLDDVRFIGRTLWSDFNLYGDPITAMRMAEIYINDFRAIQNFSTERCSMLSERHCKEIESACAKRPDNKKVVVTHFCPTSQSVHPAYESSKFLNPYFVNNYRDLVNESGAILWVHGHSHKNFDYEVGDTRVVCNPKGYGSENGNDFNYDLVLEI